MNTLSPGTVLGRYTLRRVLGEGGVGAVCEAVHVDLEPANIFLGHRSRDGLVSPEVLDVGIARLHDPRDARRANEPAGRRRVGRHRGQFALAARRLARR